MAASTFDKSLSDCYSWLMLAKQIEDHMQVNMLDAKNKLSSLVAAAEQGEEVIIARDGVPVARLVKYNRPKIKAPGAWKGLARISRDWNSEETNAAVEGLFYGNTEPGKNDQVSKRKRTAKR